MSKEKQFSISAIVLSVLITASASFLLSQYYFESTADKETFIPEEFQTDDNANTGEELKYFRDRVILSNENGDDSWVLELDLNRKENKKGKYIHYSTATLFQNGKKESINTNFPSNSPTIKVNKFLQEFENETFGDLSTRESYAFAIQIGDKKIHADLANLEGDFITKNQLVYTRYLSEGSAKVEIDGEEYTSEAALEKTYSSDHSKYIFFPGLEKLSSRTYRFLLWDESGNFYLLDNSVVNKENPYYKPHTWILYKNADPKYLQKAFAANIEFTEIGEVKSWQIEIPDLDTTLSISAMDATDESWIEGTATGAVTNNGNKEKVYGAFSFKKE